MDRSDQIECRIDELVCSDAFESRLGHAHVARLAESIRDRGLIHPPIVRADTMEVIAGEDRVAAHVLLNASHVLCDLVFCSDEEVTAIREAENKHRRPHTGAELLELVERKVKTILPPPPAPSHTPASMPPLPLPPLEEPDVGRPKTERTKAIEELAAETGRSPEAIRKATERAAKKKAKEAAVGAPASGFETWGREVPAELLESTTKAHKALTEASSKVSAAIAALTKLQKEALIRDGLANQIAVMLQDAGRALRGARPSALCPWCKGQEKLLKGCAACFGTAYAVEATMDMIPATLRDPRIVMALGKEMRLAEPPPAPVGHSSTGLEAYDGQDPFDYDETERRDSDISDLFPDDAEEVS